MTIEQHLATIDLLCARDFPEQRGGSDVGFGGPGFHVAELATSVGLRSGDGAARERTAEDFDAWKESIARRLDDRWGPGQRSGLLAVSVRGERGEEIPEPWAMLSDLVHELCVWQAEVTGRWVALGVAERDETDEIRLIAVVTDTDPP
ncbi:hypothetical protein ACFOZ0_33890 [Streptomyces yaanensis]|uniref:Barstar (barnase inhibitor) domain-containing protein n=1 Tax=Streptomyces yaanensis TaxID=1142239 RepID=A0ABV7SMG4_9ACTN|nr:hypothetical protein [Streptomyces sp. CGMCC 4.7035]WNC00459.1 hypothetical protein Q2K21_21700 [Streptomyces sp. CGMCC 4.7035]